MKRTFQLVLAILVTFMLVPAAFACDGEGQTADNSDTVQADTVAPEATPEANSDTTTVSNEGEAACGCAGAHAAGNTDVAATCSHHADQQNTESETVDVVPTSSDTHGGCNRGQQALEDSDNDS